MKLHTEVALSSFKKPLLLSDGILAMGSCFAEHLGSRLKAYKFAAEVNPGGILFNPLSIYRILSWAMGKEEWGQQLMVENEGVWTHFHLHSQVYGKSQEELEEKMAGLRAHFLQIIPKINCLLLTMGTAWVYEHKALGQPVANCHKVVAKQFEKRLLSVQEVEQSIRGIQQLLPGVNIVLTVSPVRHLKDTLSLNMVSKSVLRLACHELSGAERVEYFPAYEILLDELRDYRFYQDDLLHPNLSLIHI